MSQKTQEYLRFTVEQRIEHWVAVFAFVILAVTGLPQKFVGYQWAESSIAALGGIEAIRIYHRFAAVILILVTIYHGAVITYKVFVKRTPLTMNPGPSDVTDLLNLIRYNLGLIKERPKLPRYNFEEKLEYWAFVWGTAVMVITGFMLWNPIATAEFLPGSFIPAALAAHGGEALLAVAAIIVWHMWGVHLRHFNKSMFTGKLSREDMEHDHALELEAIENDTLPPPSPPEEVAARRKIYVPVAAVILLVLIVGLFWFVTFEDTAIETVVAAEQRTEPFQPLQLDPGRPSLHPTMSVWSGAEDCTGSGCHSAAPLETAAASEHSRRVAAAGPDPLLAKLEEGIAPAEESLPDCLVCHAETYNPDDLLASAHSVRAAGGDTCLRCHGDISHPQDVHTQVGMSCVSCHGAFNHQIQTQVACTDCHDAQPHTDPLLNTKHDRLDCRTCHIKTGSELTIDVSRPVKDPITTFFGPTIEEHQNGQSYAWYKGNQPASIETEGAQIVPFLPVTILAPTGFDPINYAQTGQVDEGELLETETGLIPSHGIDKAEVRTCVSCHGPESTFDFGSLGYGEENGLSTSKPVVEAEAE
jgi:cytochrome b subunit of formate dehydrogenase